MSDEYTLPVAEQFLSIQGEGIFVGQVQYFIRLAGCNVGKPQALADKLSKGIPDYRDQCTTWDGRTFDCDTNYRLKETKTVAQLVEDTGEIKHISITGGEPFLHTNLYSLVVSLVNKGKIVHIETSGTLYKEWIAKFLRNTVWITVSPKAGWKPEMIEAADELKLLVDEYFDIANIPADFKRCKKVYLQPINNEHSINDLNLQKCIDIVTKNPDWRISVQMHKILKVR